MEQTLTTPDGIDIAYEVFDGGGTPLLLVMGLGTQMVFWPEPFCEAFAERGYKVIRFDNRDVGNSTRLDHLSAPKPHHVIGKSLLKLNNDVPYLLTDMARDARHLLDGLDIERAHVVGASMGGMIAQTLAIESPERVASLTSIMSTTGSRRAGLPRPTALKALLTRPGKGKDAYLDHVVHIYSAIGNQTHPLDEEALRYLASLAWDRGGPSPRGFLRQFAAITASGSRRHHLRKLDTPALVIHGSQDPLIPLSGGKDTARCIPGARLVVYDDMGHDLPRARWPDFIREIDGHAQSATR